MKIQFNERYKSDNMKKFSNSQTNAYQTSEIPSLTYKKSEKLKNMTTHFVGDVDCLIRWLLEGKAV